MSAVSMYLAQNAYTWFKSPFSGLEVQIKKLTELKRGDVITFYYRGLKHDGIVSNVEINSGDNKDRLSIVHYSWPSLISGRKIVEEEIEINLTKNKVLRHDYSGYTVYHPDEVIRRARMRIGESKFAVFSNRSSHFCFWAKVNETPKDCDLVMKHDNTCQLQYDRPFSRNQGDLKLPQVYIDHRRGKLITTNIYEKRHVRIRTEIKPGDVIEFKFHCGLLHKAICTAIRSSTFPSKVQLTIVHYGSSYTVVEETRSFDLNRDTINVYLYHPLHRFERKDVIRRARAKVNEQNYCIIGRSASHFADSISSRGKDYVITSLEDVQLGDVIIYSYWGLWHEAVVIKKPIGHFEIVHYGLQSILATREIIKEELRIDVTKQVIQKKGFNGYYTYPNEVTVARAMSRIGQQRFSCFGNRSFEFVHWCKVVQMPSVYSLKYIGNGNDDSKTIRKVVIIPQTGEVHTEFFHKNWIQHWEDFNIGTILRLQDTYGILVSLNQKSNTIGLCYSSSEGRVRLRRFHIDLKKSKECIWMYWCNPCKCHSPEETIDRALNRKMYKIPDDATAWEFCKRCVIKDEDDMQTDYALSSIEYANDDNKTIRKVVIILQTGEVHTEWFPTNWIKNWEDLTIALIIHLQCTYGILVNSDQESDNIDFLNRRRNWKVKLRCFHVDVNKGKESIWIYWCNPSKCHSPDDIIARALNKTIDDENTDDATDWEFCKCCAKKDIFISWNKLFLLSQQVNLEHFKAQHISRLKCENKSV